MIIYLFWNNSMLLKDIASIKSGYHLRGKLSPVPDGDLAIVQMSDIQADRTIVYPSLTRIDGRKVNPEHLLEYGDVLLTNRGRNNEGVHVDSKVSGIVAASHFYRIRLQSPDLKPEFLAWYLNQPLAQRELGRFKKSSSIPLLSREGVASLFVPIPPIEVQEKIATVGALLQKEVEILEELTVLRHQLISAQLLTKVSTYENGESNV